MEITWTWKYESSRVYFSPLAFQPSALCESEKAFCLDLNIGSFYTLSSSSPPTPYSTALKRAMPGEKIYNRFSNLCYLEVIFFASILKTTPLSPHIPHTTSEEKTQSIREKKKLKISNSKFYQFFINSKNQSPPFKTLRYVRDQNWWYIWNRQLLIRTRILNSVWIFHTVTNSKEISAPSALFLLRMTS